MFEAVLLALAVTLGAQPAEDEPLRIAAPTLGGSGLEAEKLSFLTEYLGEALTAASGGSMQVVTSSQIATMLGFEREKALLGCPEDSASCLAELAGALGSNSVLVGNVARFGGRYAVTLRVVSAADGRQLAGVSGRDIEEEKLPAFLTGAARTMAVALLGEETVKANEAAGARQRVLDVDSEPLQGQLRLNAIALEADLEFASAYWAGARLGAGINAVGLARPQLPVILPHITGMLRWHPYRRGDFFTPGVYLGAGAALHADSSGSGAGLRVGPIAFVGAELGYRWVRLSLEVGWTNASGAGALLVMPALGVAIPVSGTVTPRASPR